LQDKANHSQPKPRLQGKYSDIMAGRKRSFWSVLLETMRHWAGSGSNLWMFMQILNAWGMPRKFFQNQMI